MGNSGPFDNNPETMLPPVFGTQETLSGLGRMAERITGWAGMPVVVLSGNDFTNRNEDGSIDAQDVRTFIEDNTDLDASLITDGFFEKFAEYLTIGRVAAKAFGPETQKTGHFCVVLASDGTKAAKDHLISISHMPENLVENAPGTAREWEVAITQHEATHCTQEINNGVARWDLLARRTTEIDADQGMTDITEMEINDPVVPETAYIPYYMRLARAISGMNGQSSPSHYTASGVFLPGEAVDLHAQNGPAYTETIMPVMQEHKRAMARLSDNQETWVGAYEQIYNILGRNVFEGVEEQDVLDGYNQGDAQLYADAGDFESFRESLKAYPVFYSYLEVFAGDDLQDSSPESYKLSYDAAQQMLSDSDFLDDYPDGKRLLELYVEGLETYMPSTVTPQEPQHTFTPIVRADWKP